MACSLNRPVLRKRRIRRHMLKRERERNYLKSYSRACFLVYFVEFYFSSSKMLHLISNQVDLCSSFISFVFLLLSVISGSPFAILIEWSFRSFFFVFFFLWRGLARHRYYAFHGSISFLVCRLSLSLSPIHGLVYAMCMCICCFSHSNSN